MITGLIRDVRFAIRMLARTPGFSLIALLTFALGIGVNAAVFTVYNGVLLRAAALSRCRPHHHGVDG